ncbi:MAG TPA: hypothetical protein VK453_21905 [Micromonosporaceae bacterium]|nr:hypothetical protein [Micromonosporaceae bacterium]
MDEARHGYDREGSSPSGVTGASGLHRSEDSPWASASSDAALEALVASWGEFRSGDAPRRSGANGHGTPARGRAEVRSPYADLIAPVSPSPPVPGPPDAYPAPSASAPPVSAYPPSARPHLNGVLAPQVERPGPAGTSAPDSAAGPPDTEPAGPARPGDPAGPPSPVDPGATGPSDSLGAAGPPDTAGSATQTGSAGAAGDDGPSNGARASRPASRLTWSGRPDQAHSDTPPREIPAPAEPKPQYGGDSRPPWAPASATGRFEEPALRYASEYDRMSHEPRAFPQPAREQRENGHADASGGEDGRAGGTNPDHADPGRQSVEPAAHLPDEVAGHPADWASPLPLPPGYAPMGSGPRPHSEQAARYDRYRQRAEEFAAYAATASRTGDGPGERPGALAPSIRPAAAALPDPSPPAPVAPTRAEVADLPQRVPAEPDVPDVPADVGPMAGEFIPAETPELARIATYLRHDELEADARPDGFDIPAVLSAVRQVPGVREAQLRPNPGGVHTLRLELAEDADPAQVSREVARLLKERMGLAAEPNTPPPTPTRAGPLSAAPERASMTRSPGAPATGAYSPEARRRRPSLVPRRLEPVRFTDMYGGSVTADPAPATVPEPQVAERPVPDPTGSGTVSGQAATPGAAQAPVREPVGDPSPAAPPAPPSGREPSPAFTVPRSRQPLNRPLTSPEVVPDGTSRTVPAAPTESAVPVAQAESAVPVAPTESAVPRPRVVIEHVQVTTENVDAIVEVRLANGGSAKVGVASGPAVDGYVLRLCAVAAGAAVDQLLEPRDGGPVGRCYIEHASVVTLGSSQVAVVVLLLVSSGWVEQLTGSALVEGDARQAIVRATLAAVNRRVESLLA